MQDYLEELLDQPLMVDEQSLDYELEPDEYLDECVEV